jgi:hypothetical protein
LASHYSRLVCVSIPRSRIEEDETQFGKPNTAKSRKRDTERGWVPEVTIEEDMRRPMDALY